MNNKTKESIRYKDKHYFNKIDTPEKAYVVGFLSANGYVSNKSIELNISFKDLESMKFIKNELGGNILIDKTTNRKQRRFSVARIAYYNNTLVRDLIKLLGGTYKENRRLPIINGKLERYLLIGFFDASGCLSWGKRKDRDRLWHKISFSSRLKLLEGLQNIIYNQVGIPTKIRPKSSGKSYVMEFAGKEEIMLFLEYIYSDDFIVLNRKYQNANNLRLELEEFGRS